jgi:hypothetical protein
LSFAVPTLLDRALTVRLQRAATCDASHGARTVDRSRTQFIRALARFVAIGSRRATRLPTVLLNGPQSGCVSGESTMFERFVIRTLAFGLSGFVTLSILAALGSTADIRHEQACLAHAVSTGQIQQVVVTGQRLPRS